MLSKKPYEIEKDDDFNERYIRITVDGMKGYLKNHLHLVKRDGRKKPKNLRVALDMNYTHLRIGKNNFPKEDFYSWRKLLWLKYLSNNPDKYLKLLKIFHENEVIIEDPNLKKILESLVLGLKPAHEELSEMIRQIKTILTIELVPETCWFTNLRSELTEEAWNRIRRQAYRESNYRCAICGGIGPKHPVEAHEVWHYDDNLNIQRLIGVIALCPSCHAVKHMGRTMKLGDPDSAFEHMKKVNKIKDDEELKILVIQAFQQWEKRSKFKWELDMSVITRKYNITLGDFRDEVKHKYTKHFRK